MHDGRCACSIYLKTTLQRTPCISPPSRARAVLARSERHTRRPGCGRVRSRRERHGGQRRAGGGVLKAVIEHLRELVACDTTNPPRAIGADHPALRYACDVLGAAGFEIAETAEIAPPPT